MDNVEWFMGVQPKFGLYRVDIATQKRTPKLSAHWCREMARPMRSCKEEPKRRLRLPARPTGAADGGIDIRACRQPRVCLVKPVHHKGVTVETSYLQTQPLWRVDAAQQK
jgi:Glycosyl hydrolase family 1